MTARAAPLFACLVLAALAGCEPEPTDGALDGGPLAEMPDRDWAWRDVPGMRCRDGSATGVGVRRVAGSRRIVVLFQGGGLCLTPETCAKNRASYGADDFARTLDRMADRPALSDRDGAPFADWNAVFVPYCTGDLHAGTRASTIPGVDGRQQFAGAANLDAVLGLLAPAAGRAEAVLLAGSSAGGYGAAPAYDRAARALAPAPVHLVDDAGPLLPALALSVALQRAFADVFGLALPADCAACAPDAEGLAALIPHLARRHPGHAFGLVAHAEDRAIRNLASAVAPGCSRYGDPACRLPAATYREGLDALDDTFAGLPNAGLFILPGDGHSALLTVGLDELSSDGVRLTDWLAGLSAGTARSVGAQ
ncbi:pectin acetylesterase-family hydrolase [Rubrivirga sp. IMCC45206]|uniref:pectin acetylesterase-family hydrolase n=1 Tax=Rubrivirga sp. IMCC45206 TaxID=3391614 RepID=UPI00398FE02A